MSTRYPFYLLLIAALLPACQQSSDPSAEPVVVQPIAADAAGSEASTQPAVVDIRLPGDVIPTRYVLDLEIIPDQERFSGKLRIDVDIKRSLSTIAMHGRELNVTSAQLKLADGSSIQGTFHQTTEQGSAMLELESEVGAQVAALEFEYDAPFNEQLQGIYKVEESGHSYAFSQMEALSARLAFPSFDEPTYKTPFVTSVTTRSDYEAISNAIETATDDLGNGLKKVQFAPTPPLPTYLIAFTVGPVDVVEWTDIAPTEVRAHPLRLRGISANGKGKQLSYALKNTAGILSTLEAYFGTPYPYDKLDIVAAPDFRAGAMENAGLIIYRESLLLLDDNPPLWQQRAYASVHAHELAHQWFGNLVTMPWWDDIWLNEAFATWMGHKAVDQWNPDYHFDRKLQQRSMTAMEADSLLSTRQIREPVTNEDGVRNAFDGITYSKGGGVLAMFEAYLGEDAFRQGVRNHMQRFAHGTASVSDFIESLTLAAPDKNIKGAFESFLFQPGVPFLHLTLDCSGDQPSVALRQERYLPLGSAGEEPRSWQIPVCLSYAIDDQTRSQCVMLNQPAQSVVLEGTTTCPDWIMPNHDGAGYYRFAMDQQSLRSLSGAADKHLNVLEKMALADSLAAAMANGSLPVEAVLEALPKLIGASERTVVEAPIKSLITIIDHIVDAQSRPAAQAYAAALYEPRLAGIDGLNGAESPAEGALLRASLIDFLALHAEAPVTRAEMAAAGAAYLGFGGDGNIHADAVDPDLLVTALTVAGENADLAFYEHMLTHFNNSTNALTRGALLKGLGAVRDLALRQRSLDLALDDGLRVNEIRTLLQAAMSYQNREALWLWFVDNHQALLARYPPEALSRMPGTFDGYCSDHHVQRLFEFFDPLLEKNQNSRRTLTNTIEGEQLCVALRAKQQPGAVAYLRSLAIDE